MPEESNYYVIWKPLPPYWENESRHKAVARTDVKEGELDLLHLVHEIAQSFGYKEGNPNKQGEYKICTKSELPGKLLLSHDYRIRVKKRWLQTRDIYPQIKCTP